MRDLIHRYERDLGSEVLALFDREDVTELGTNPGSESIWIDTRGEGMVKTSATMPKKRVRAFLNRAADRNNEQLTRRNPRIECAMPQSRFGGARLSGSIPPVVPAPGFCLRKFASEVIPLKQYVDDEIMTAEEGRALLDAVDRRLNIFVVGGTGSGKTTLAESLLNEVGKRYPAERIVTLEDTYELTLKESWNWYPMRTQSQGDYTRLIEMALRLSPDRLVVGESRGRSLLQLFDALLSGHDGGISTFHASSVESALRRMYLYCLRDSDTRSHRYTIGDAIDLMVILKKEQGKRFVDRMVRIHGYSEERGYELEEAVDALGPAAQARS